MSEQISITRTQNGQGAIAAAVAATEPLFAPNVDIFESEREYLLEVDFPGVTQDALSVRLDGSQLTIDGRRPGIEGFFGASRLSRSFRVPDTIDPDRIEAELAHGILRVRLAKREDAMPRRITVRALD